LTTRTGLRHSGELYKGSLTDPSTKRYPASCSSLVGDRMQFDQLRRRGLVILLGGFLPATFSGRQYAEAGGLMNYGAGLTDAWRQVGGYTGRILKGRHACGPAGGAVEQVRARDMQFAAVREFAVGRERAMLVSHSVHPQFKVKRLWVRRCRMVSGWTRRSDASPEGDDARQRQRHKHEAEIYPGTRMTTVKTPSGGLRNQTTFSCGRDPLPF
jgi:hypothetical protein